MKTIDLKPASPDTSKPLAVGQTAPAGGFGGDPEGLHASSSSAGPQLDYPAPDVAAIKAYEESGGRELIMLDSTMHLGKEEPAAENAELEKVPGGLGRYRRIRTWCSTSAA